jgi:rhodanese-related sulfurtransferase
VAHELAERGFRDVHALHGGFEAWIRAGQPVERLIHPVEV